MSDLSGRISQANGRLRSAKVGITIEQRGDRLLLRGTFPPRPGSKKDGPHQQRISLRVKATPAGLKQAESEARKISALLDCKEFSWEPYLKEPAETIGQWVSQFEGEYFARRDRTPKTWKTWSGDYEQVFKRLPQDAAITADALRETILTTAPNTKSRKRYCLALGALARFAGVDFDAKAYRGDYSAQKVQPRDLPSDEAIVQAWQAIPAPEWRWVFGMIATYGLRPGEIFQLDIEAYTGTILAVTDGKTGRRLVWPLYPEWVRQFDLTAIQCPQVSGYELSNRVGQYFRRRGLPRAYDLRHRWAVRALEFKLDVCLAAQQMGHSVRVHTEIYHHWITADTHQRAWEAAMNRENRPLPPVLG